jgi:hypothetical protein
MIVDEKLLSLEQEAITKLITEFKECRDILINQLHNSSINSREFTGSGFYTNFNVSNDAKVIEKKISPFGNVYAKINDEFEVGFILFFKDGKISCLECYEYSNIQFPNKITSYEFINKNQQ